MRSHVQAYVFDAYGTLFDVHSVGGLAEQLAPMMDAGATLTVTVSGFMSTIKPYLDISVMQRDEGFGAE